MHALFNKLDVRVLLIINVSRDFNAVKSATLLIPIDIFLSLSGGILQYLLQSGFSLINVGSGFHSVCGIFPFLQRAHLRKSLFLHRLCTSCCTSSHSSSLQRLCDGHPVTA